MKVKLGNICEIQSGGTPSRAKQEYWNGLIPWIKISDMKTKFINASEEKITEKGLKNSSAKLFDKGTILYSIFASLGVIGILDINATTNQAIAGIKVVDDNFLVEYIYYYLKSKKEYVNLIGRGVAQNNINLSLLKNFEIEEVSLSFQNKITSIMIYIENIINLYESQLKYFDNLVKSRFVEMFENKNYQVLPWAEVFNTTTGKLDSNAMVEGGQYPFFTCAKESFWIDKYAFDQEALLLAGNNAAGKYDVKYYKGKFNAYQRTYVLSLKGNWSYQLFKQQLEDKLEWLREQSKGCNTRYITLKILDELRFIIPPIEKQNEFENFVAKVDKSKFVAIKLYVC